MAGQFFDAFARATAAWEASSAAADAALPGEAPSASALPEAPNPILAALQLAWRLLLRALGLSKRR
jgi:hypothetical protein